MFCIYRGSLRTSRRVYCGVGGWGQFIRMADLYRRSQGYPLVRSLTPYIYISHLPRPPRFLSILLSIELLVDFRREMIIIRRIIIIIIIIIIVILLYYVSPFLAKEGCFSYWWSFPTTSLCPLPNWSLFPIFGILMVTYPLYIIITIIINYTCSSYYYYYIFL